MPLSINLREYIAACFTAIWVQSHEHEDALAEIAQLCRDENWRLATWDVSQGLQVTGQTEEAESTGTDPLAATRWPRVCFFWMNARRDSPVSLVLARRIAECPPGCSVRFCRG